MVIIEDKRYRKGMEKTKKKYLAEKIDWNTLVKETKALRKSIRIRKPKLRRK